MNDLNVLMGRVDNMLNGIESDHAVSPQKVWNTLLRNPNVVTITYKREGDDVRAIAINGDSYGVIGIRKEQMIGRLLSEFVIVPKDVIKMFIDTVDRDGFMTKIMPLGQFGTVCEMTIAKEENGRYVEFVKRA